MRNYYYCEANGAVYTENEKVKSDWPACRFIGIGKYTKRVDAETAWDDKHWNDAPVTNNKRN